MNDTEHESVPENKKGFTINASPLNPVKLDLGLVLIIGFMLLMLNEKLSDSRAVQFAILGGYGIVAMVYLIWRTRKLVKKANG